MSSRWPSNLWIVRHGQSAGNVARDNADAAGALKIDLSHRDVDIPLSDLGRKQSTALGHWFSALDVRPTVILCSPYVRALETASLFQAAGGTDPAACICLDERLREKEFGILDGLTRAGIEHFHPEQADYRKLLGKFYHRPPGGESWADVILRLRSVLDTISLHHRDKPVMIVAHQVVVLCLRYILEGISEREILEVDGQGDVANCSITEYVNRPTENGDGTLELVSYNVVTPLERDDAVVTRAPDRMVAARG